MRVGLGGTFGPIHDGHRALIREALARGDDGVFIGVTSDALAVTTRETLRTIPPFYERKRMVENEVLRLDEWGRDVNVEKLTDEFGPAVTDPRLDALVVSPETAGSLDEINRIRRSRGLDDLAGVVVPFVRADDDARISSTRIVEDEVDEHGTI